MVKEGSIPSSLEESRKAASGGISETLSWSVLPLVEELVAEQSLALGSCLDIGSGIRTKHEWFHDKVANPAPGVFRASEIDSKLRAKLSEKGIESERGFEDIDDHSYDLAIALEVLEHLRPEDSIDFLRNAARITKKVFAMTVPNFEYWDDRLRAKPDFERIRWIPDHFLGYDPNSDNPHRHKQMIDPDRLLGYLHEGFGSNEWDYIVLRAWPWHLRDIARKTEVVYYFKLFAVAVRRF